VPLSRVALRSWDDEVVDWMGADVGITGARGPALAGSAGPFGCPL